MFRYLIAAIGVLSFGTAHALDFDLADSERPGVFPSTALCEEGARLPAFIFKSQPRTAQTLALVLRSREPSGKSAVIWFVYDIPATAKNFSGKQNDEHFLTGLNDKSKREYDAPCRSGASKAVEIQLLAVDSAPKFFAPPTVDDYMSAVKGHILESQKKSFAIDKAKK